MQARELYSVQYDSSWPPESIAHSDEASSGARGLQRTRFFLPLRAYALKGKENFTGLQPPYRCWPSRIFSALLLILDTNL